MRTGALLLLLSSAAACSRDTAAPAPRPTAAASTGDTAGVGDRFASEPELLRPEAPVGGARELVVTATVEVPLEVRLTGPTGERVVRWPAATRFQVPVVGLRPDAQHTIEVVLDPDGVASRRSLSLTGDPLPETLPELDVLALDPAAVAPGHTLFAATTPGISAAWLLLLDAQAVPVWWAYSDTRLGDLRLTDDGTLLGLGDFDIVELDWLGRERRHLTSDPRGTAPPVDVDWVHHEVVPLPGGHLLTLDQALIDVDDLPVGYDDTSTLAPAAIVDNGVVELDPSGHVVRRVALSERLPTSRVSWNGLDPVAALGGGRDWAHANAVVPDDDGGWVVSVRHQDALVKLTAEGEIAWILGDPAGWPAPWSEGLLAPEGEVVWPYHQHAPELTRDADGLRVLLFDNVNDGHTPYGPAPGGDRPSRLVELRVNEAAGTVEQLWSFELDRDGPLASMALGDADRLDNGHVLGVWGMLTAEGGLDNLDQGRGKLSARLAEVDPATGAVVFDLRVGDRRARVPDGWSVYRAERLPRLHPTATSEAGP